MGFIDGVRDFGLVTLGTMGGLVQDWAGSSLRKAEDEKPAGDDSRGPVGDSGKQHPVPDEKATADPKALFWDPFAIIEQLGYKDRPSQITYGTLKAMAWKVPIIHSIIQTRVNQVAAFSRVQHDRYQLGFRVKMRDTEKEPQKADRLWIKEMETVLTRTGVTDNPRGRDGFKEFLKKLAWDSLVYDQMCFEVVPNRKGQPAEWYAVDAATIRRADTTSTFIDEDKLDTVRFVQIYDGLVIAEYTQEEMCFGVRNPRTDIKLFGYGVSELEMLIPAVTSLLYAWEYNQRFFSQGSAAKGIINFKGTVPEVQLQQFRRHWYQMISGVENSWRTPITNAEDLQYVNLQQSSRDMEFNAWMDFLIKVSCAMYSMDPAELNFKYGNTGQKSSMNEANNKEKITESKERGLRPMLRFMEDAINQHLIWPISEDFEFAFVGLDALTRKDHMDLAEQQSRTYLTIDEIRAQDDMEPLPDGKGEVILNPVYLQHASAKDQAAQAAAGGGMPGGMPGGQMGDGQEAGGDQSDSGKSGGVDFEKLLGQYNQEDDQKPNAAEPAQAEKPAEPAKPAQGEVAKSMVVVDLSI
jgi:hypothetical protein